MPPLTRADKIQIDEYIQAGQIHNARRMLQESDDPQAKAALEKLNRKYPPQAGFAPDVINPASPRLTTTPRPTPVSSAPTPALTRPKSSPATFAPTMTDLAPDMPRDEMTDVRLAIKEKRYDDARGMLILSDHPDADKMLERLSHLGGSEKVKRISADVDVDLTAKFQITFFLLIFLTVFGLIALGIFVPEAKKYPNAPGAGGLLLMNKIVRFILYGILALLVAFLALLFISYLTRPGR